MFFSEEQYEDLVGNYCKQYDISLLEFACLSELSEATIRKYRDWATTPAGKNSGYVREPHRSTQQNIAEVLKNKNPRALLEKLKVPKPRLVCSATADQDITPIIQALSSKGVVLFEDFAEKMKEASKLRRAASSVISLTGQLSSTDVTELVRKLAAQNKPITLKELVTAYMASGAVE